MLHLDVVRAGRVERRSPERRQELLYVVAGSGALHVDGERHELEKDTAALLLPCERYEIEAGSGLELVSVTTPSGARAERGPVTRRLEDAPLERVDEHRSFRVLFETDVTQFVGFVQPSRAPDHSHPYDEVGYILEGSGFIHVEGGSTPIGPGSRFHLPPGKVHCVENSGPGVMRILGIFHPAGSPRQRS